MQVLKEEIRDRIMETAKALFLEKGFQRTSMKNIAEGAGITAPTIYCYFRSKDQLFRELVKPVTHYFEEKKKEVAAFDVTEGVKSGNWGFEARRSQYTSHFSFVIDHREEFILIFSSAGGSSLENYFDSLVMEYEKLMRSMIQSFSEMIPGSTEISDFFIHNMAAFYVNSLREAALHPVTGKELEQFAAEWALFRTAGWVALTKQEISDRSKINSEKGR